MKKKIIILVTLLLPIILLGQSEALKFKESTYDFGTIKEEGGTVTHIFEFQNEGESPVIVRNVESSCGCTTPVWTKAPILPKESGMIKVTYNPLNRPNTFVKTVKVTTNIGVKELIIKGVVTPRPKSLAELYPKKMEQLRLKTSYVMFNEIGNGKAGKIIVEAVNYSDKAITVAFGDMPDYIKIEISKNNLAPKEKAEISVIYDAPKADFWGFHSDIVPVLVNGVVKSSNSLVVTATVIEDFSKLSKEELEKAPIVGVDKLEAHFQTAVVSGDKVKTQFKITNIGKQPLILRRIDTSIEAINAEIAKTVIQSNTQEVLNVTFDTKGKKGYQNHQIIIITNAPDLPVLNLKLSGIVN